jgi:lipoate-protein ligase A
MKEWMLIVEPEPLKGSRNMAVDEYLFRQLKSRPRTFLRFYQWQRPTASLGYSQKTEKVIDLEFCRRNGIDVVRRITGGKLVLHHQEITYSVSSSDASAFTSTLGGSYRLISQALVKGLENMGLQATLAEKTPAFYARGTLPCFSHPARDEIEVDGKKIAGSAQKRTGPIFLQHGSIPLAHDETLLKSVSLLKNEPADIRMTSLSEALGRAVDFRWAVERLIKGFREFFGVRFEEMELNPPDWKKIQEIQVCKYENKEWTLNGFASTEDKNCPVDF